MIRKRREAEPRQRIWEGRQLEEEKEEEVDAKVEEKNEGRKYYEEGGCK